MSLALQGGGSHGAFTGGVLDRLLEDERIEIKAISGAVNAVVLLSVESKLDSHSSFLTMLRDHGRARAESWLENNFDLVGERSSIDLGELFC